MLDRRRRRLSLRLVLLAPLVLVAPDTAAQDADGDGVPDSVDNCPTLHNPNQDGGTPVQLNDGGGPSFRVTADSSTVVYQVTDGSNQELYSVPIEGGTVTQITSVVPLGRVGFSWSVSPDSAHVVYLSDPDTENIPEVYSVPIAGGPVTKLNLPLAPDGRVFDHAISADGARVVYEANQNSVTELFSVPTTGGPVTKLHPDLTLGHSVTEFALSPDGTTVVFLGDLDTVNVRELYSVPIEGGALTKLSAPGSPSVGSGGWEITPDSAKVVFKISARDLNSVPIGGGPVTVLVPALPVGRSIGGFEISRDSARVVYRADAVIDNIFELYSVPIGGGAVTKLNPDILSGDVFPFDISPDGAWVTYRADHDADNVRELNIVPIAGGAITKLSPVGHTIQTSSFSHDSARVVYVREHSPFELYSVPIAGGAVTQLNAPMQAGSFGTLVYRICPDGDVLYLADQDMPNVWELFTVSIEGGTASDVHPPLPAGWSVGSFTGDADCRRVVYNVDATYSMPLVSDNDGDGILRYCDVCPGDVSNIDTDADTVCENSDNCPLVANPGQADADVDGLGNVCDACPLDSTNTDIDADTVCGSADNCPTIANFDQTDGDSDGFGDACDTCPDDPGTDVDGDLVCAGVDNCDVTFNPAQGDQDGDGVGTSCDNCASSSNAPQIDADADGAGDACDCQPADSTDRRPAEVLDLALSRAGSVTTLSWSSVPSADAYAITRGALGTLGSTYGACLVDGLTGTSYPDSSNPAQDEGFAYLIQAQNFDCGLGTSGFTSAEQERQLGPGACAGVGIADTHASAETPVFGTVSGAFLETLTSDDAAETITEVLSTGGSPSTRFSRLEHRWSFTVAAGSAIELHVEGFRSASTDGDDFHFEWSTNGGTSFTPVTMASLPPADGDTDLVGALPGTVVGSVLIRVVDTDRTSGNQTLDSVAIDEVFIRSIP